MSAKLYMLEFPLIHREKLAPTKVLILTTQSVNDYHLSQNSSKKKKLKCQLLDFNGSKTSVFHLKRNESV